MELQFQSNSCDCLRSILYEVRNQEQTQELKLGDSMPDAGRIIAAFGQVILRGKEWRADSVSVSGGVLVWVLYDPESSAKPTVLDSWIPFQLKWDLPEGTPEGEIRTDVLLRSVDARIISPRKIMLRAGVSGIAEALVAHRQEVYTPSQIPEDVQLLKNRYPADLFRESGEKTVNLDEETDLPQNFEQIVSYRLQPRITERKVLTDKVVFRGIGELSIVYMNTDGRLASRIWELPFSQIAQLTGNHSSEAWVEVTCCVTELELDAAEDRFRLKCALVVQMLVSDREMLEIVEDACSHRRSVEPRQELLRLPAVLDVRSEHISGEESLAVEAKTVVDTVFLPEYPRQRRMGDQTQLEFPGICQVLYYDKEGILQCANARWEGTLTQAVGEECQLIPQLIPGQTQASIGGSGIRLRPELTVQQRCMASEGIPMVTGLDLGPQLEPVPGRPSVVLCRCRRQRLWDLAKTHGSTVDAIRRANDLKGEPEEGRMLLIPVL